MKFLALVFLLTTTFLQAQTWQQTNIDNNTSGQRFDDVFFLNETLGWAANGFFASVYKTVDGGVTWEEQLNEADLGGAYYFRNIEFLNEDIGFVGTLNSLFLRTIDGGDSWETVTNITPNPLAICGLDAVNDTTIYGCGAFFGPAFVIKSTDAGANWVHTDMSDYATALVEILFTDEQIGYAGGQNNNGACLLKTEDGGTTWTEIYNSNIPGEYVWKLQTLDSNPNMLFGAVSSVAPHLGKLIKSNNSGATWQSFDAPETDIQAVGFITENTGWMGGHTTGFYETNDGGQTWTNTGVGNNLNRIFIVNSNLAYGCGTSVYKYTDASLSIGINEVETTPVITISLSENPIKNILEIEVTFESSDNIVIELYDIQGRFINQLSREIIDFKQTKIYQFNVEDLPTGSYFLNVHSNTGRKPFKFLKQ